MSTYQYTSVYHHFLEEPPHPTRFQTSKYLFGAFFPALGKSLVKYITGEKPVKEWSFLYHVATHTLRDVLITFQSGDPPDIHMIQRTTVIPTAIPRRGKLILDPFRVEQEVIDFIHKQEPGEWPPHASDMYEVHAEWVIPPSIDEDYVFYLIHGGAYILGSAQMERNFAYRYGKHSRCKVFAVSYRLAPQNPYPCGLIDVVSGYLHLLAKYEANKIVLMGDSAGGGLVLATLLLLRDMGKPLPAGGLDLTQSRPSLITNAFSDYIPDMPKDSRLGDRVNYYAPNHLLKVPYVSPYWADDLSNLPPLLIQTGNAEKLHDEICEFSHNLSKIPNAYITLESYHAHVHVFQMLYFNKGAKVAVKRMAQWIKQITGREASARTESRHFKLDHHGNILITQDFADITR